MCTILISHWLKAALVEMDVKVGSSDQKKTPGKEEQVFEVSEGLMSPGLL